ncbi:hypothetical protein Pan181_37240 [Aeoliella mucimassa]|uniref:Uncharacterized protein n=2 Tax=Aeoliella mucimassa TaxID=2527972 RepID=A0A518AS04_9BACT|nr:hypothetical protein Pan181_37240 [Aeoliella mucimassa]
MRYEQSSYSTGGQWFSHVIVEGGTIGIIANDLKHIVRLWCSPPYSGKWKGRYLPGMTVGEVVQASQKQLAIHGVLVLDGVLGIGFTIPEQYNGRWYDDIDSVEQLPMDMRLDELNVLEDEWWS